MNSTPTPALIEKIVRDLALAHKQTKILENLLQEAVRKHMHSHGNQSQLAKSLGLSRAYLSDIQHGRRRISPQFLEKLLAITPANGEEDIL